MELNRQLQDQLSALREEHQGMIQQLKEAHSVIDRHIESTTMLSANEVKFTAATGKLACSTLYYCRWYWRKN